MYTDGSKALHDDNIIMIHTNLNGIISICVQFEDAYGYSQYSLFDIEMPIIEILLTILNNQLCIRVARDKVTSLQI